MREAARQQADAKARSSSLVTALTWNRVASAAKGEVLASAQTAATLELINMQNLMEERDAMRIELDELQNASTLAETAADAAKAKKVPWCQQV